MGEKLILTYIIAWVVLFTFYVEDKVAYGLYTKFVFIVFGWFWIGVNIKFCSQAHFVQSRHHFFY